MIVEHKHIHTSLQQYMGNILLRLLQSGNTVNSKLKFKTILINKLQLFPTL